METNGILPGEPARWKEFGVLRHEQREGGLHDIFGALKTWLNGETRKSLVEGLRDPNQLVRERALESIFQATSRRSETLFKEFHKAAKDKDQQKTATALSSRTASRPPSPATSPTGRGGLGGQG
uniref:HEAT repeat domain-containing protein n=1 Tax=Chromera velia CCMP2878 TaxID=1169474 RepID=A0A0G4GGI9_9ALVE|eukprot:Cvel_21807.t1-p1 / transcript=Cvel_21807.t1 / gene=Cvel_21807 / organism=Chromera_velia_CCMP2878 / gene_product=hypothetical protein / transcript_product=hypothetical protein / location=Cvel_scaffold2079:3256-7175(-) / protein_length=123 / sequence_SO=supercontig / SO=protein_coding / is_pseudo=false